MTQCCNEMDGNASDDDEWMSFVSLREKLETYCGIISTNRLTNVILKKKISQLIETKGLEQLCIHCLDVMDLVEKLDHEKKTLLAQMQMVIKIGSRKSFKKDDELERFEKESIDLVNVMNAKIKSLEVSRTMMISKGPS